MVRVDAMKASGSVAKAVNSEIPKFDNYTKGLFTKDVLQNLYG
jgi:hypothetical protein